MPLILGTNSIKDTGYEVANSLRFDDGSSDYLSRTNGGSPTSSSIFTFSCWIKKSQGVPSDHQVLFGNFDSTDNTGYFRFNDDATLRYYDKQGASNRVNYTSSALFRDVSAWYNLIVNVDTSRSSTDRVRFYSNGVQLSTNVITDTSGNLGLLTATTTNGMTLGAVKRPPSPDYEYYYDGYMCEAVFIDGQALDPTSFGEFDEDSGIWKPKDVSGLTFGTNGFYLDFENASSLGADVSGNGNNFTVNNLTSVDQSTDTCTNNFCVVNALSKGSSIVLSEGNTKITKSSGFESCMATIMPSTGKWYWENKVISLGTVNAGVTKSTQDGTTHSSVDAGRSMYSSNGTIYNEGLSASNISTGTTFTTNDIIGVALDIDGNTIKFYKNGTLIDTVSDSGISSAEGWSPAWGLSGGSFNVNFGSPSFSISSGNSDGDGYGNFEYAVPSGYFSLCTKNLAEYG